MAKKPFFQPKKQSIKSPEQAYAELLGESSENHIVEIDISLIDEIDNQPYKIKNEVISSIAESISEVGQIDPIVVVPNEKSEGRYLLIAGRHRCRACKMLGYTKVKAIIKKENNPDKLRLMLLTTNNDRNNDYSPSELAYAYKEQQEVLTRLGSKATASRIADENGMNRRTVHKYIQLANLIKPLIDRVDSGVLTVGAGYELSFLTATQQAEVFQFILNHSDIHFTKDICRSIREAPNDIENICYPTNEDNYNYNQTSDDKENIVSEKPPKAEKEKYNCPSEGHINKKTVIISQATLMTIAYILNKDCHSLIKYIINDFPTTNELIEYISNKYLKIVVCGRLDDNLPIPFTDYWYSTYTIKFSKKLDVKFINDSNQTKKIKIDYNELDSALRMYCRKYLSSEDIIAMIKNNQLL